MNRKDKGQFLGFYGQRFPHFQHNPVRLVLNLVVQNIDSCRWRGCCGRSRYKLGGGVRGGSHDSERSRELVSDPKEKKHHVISFKRSYVRIITDLVRAFHKVSMKKLVFSYRLHSTFSGINPDRPNITQISPKDRYSCGGGQ